MRKRIERLTCVFTMFIGFVLFSGCREPGSAKQLYTTPEPLTNVVNIDKDEVTAWDYESFDDAFEIGGFTTGAPDGKHEGYRGVLTLSDDIIADYELEIDDEAEILTRFDKVDISNYSSHWYYCNNLYFIFDTDWDSNILYYDGNNHILFYIIEKEN